MAKVKGLPELRAAIQHVADQMAAGGTEAVGEGAASMLADMRSRVPRRTGHEAAGLGIQTRHGGRLAQVGVLDPGVEYEEYPEFGTSEQPAQPAIQPAGEAEAIEFPRRVEAQILARLR